VAELYRTNVEGTRNLLRAFADARKDRPGTFVYISSTESTLGTTT
jgi:nucleoside-diphosphate-sugar epimerase